MDVQDKKQFEGPPDLSEFIDDKRTKEMLVDSQNEEVPNAHQSQSSIVEINLQTPKKGGSGVKRPNPF